MSPLISDVERLTPSIGSSSLKKEVKEQKEYEQFFSHLLSIYISKSEGED